MKKIFAALLALVTVLATVPTAFAADLLTVKDLNKNSTAGSHANDDFTTASIEMSFRETVDLTAETTGQSRYTKVYYPRVKKIKDDLYLLVYHYGQTGAHIYYATSADGIKWNAPKILYQNNTDASVFTYPDGEHAGETDRYIAVNPDAVALANGEILCTYYIRPNAGYVFASDYNGLYLVRGTVDANNEIVWGEQQRIYTGQGWEPYIWQRPDGRVEIYWTSIVTYTSIYGFDRDKRSTSTMMIYSEDNGHTWTPNVQPGDTNHYQAIRVFNEYIGDKIPYGTNADGTPMYTEAVPYFGGQMPVVTRLYDGRTMLAVEVQELDNNFHFSYAISDKDGNWKNLSVLEEGPTTAQTNLFRAAGPYLACFPSGEVYLTYHWAGGQYYRLGDPNGTAFSDRSRRASPDPVGLWGSSELLSSHEVLTVTPLKFGEDRFGVQLTHSYLNHRTNAGKATVTVDGSVADWADNTDALFVGSESQAQMTLQTAHDAENVYFLVNCLDTYLQTGDSVAVNVGVGKATYYTVTVDVNGNTTFTRFENGVTKAMSGNVKSVVKTYGTVGENKDTDKGYVVEIAVSKADLALVGATSFVVRPELVNVDNGGKIRDTLTGVSYYVTTAWPKVVLD